MSIRIAPSASRAAVAFLLPLLASGCVIQPEFLFGGAIEGIPGVLHATAEDGGFLVPSVITNEADARAATIYAELGPTGDAAPSGLTYEFLGTGGAVCAFVDPELLFWNQSVSTQNGERQWRYPDNPWDDGDIDLRAGLSVYYTGTVGESMGDFRVDYQDTLGNAVAIDLVACTIDADVLGPTPIATAGRGSPEFCTVFNTQPGVKYTVALEVFSTPPDDNRLAFGFILADGTCPDMIEAATGVAGGGLAGGGSSQHHECVVKGEALLPQEDQASFYYGYAEGRSWPGSEDFEQHHCDGTPMIQFCNAEAEAKEAAGQICQWENTVDYDTQELFPLEGRCFCGDLADTPSGGAF